MDSTIVAVFDNPERAEDAKRELIAKGVIGEKDVSMVRQSAATMPPGPLQRVKFMLGSPPPLRQRGVLTVYVEGDQMRQVERLVREHEPIDVKLHLSSAAAHGRQGRPLNEPGFSV